MMHASLMVSQSRCSLLEGDSRTRKFSRSWNISSNRSVYRLSSFHRLTAIWTENFKPGLVLKPATNKNMYFDAHAVVKPPKSISVDLLRLPSAASSASVIGFGVFALRPSSYLFCQHYCCRGPTTSLACCTNSSRTQEAPPIRQNSRASARSKLQPYFMPPLAKRSQVCAPSMEDIKSSSPSSMMEALA